MLQEADVFLEWMSYPPGSMFTIMFLAFVVSTISSLLTKWLVDTKEVERKQKLIKAHEEKKKKIIELAEGDVARYRKERKTWERRDAMIKKMQQGMAMSRLKPTCITFLPMIIIFWLMRQYFLNNPVACPPMNPYNLPLVSGMMMASTEGQVYEWTKHVYGEATTVSARAGWINFTAWYFICSLGISTLFQRIFKIQSQATGGGMEQMFSGQKAKSMEFPNV